MTQERHTVPRTGERNLTFLGELISNKDTITPGNDSRYTEVSLYRTGKGKFILATENISRWQGESSTANAEVFQSAEELVGSLVSSEISDLMKELFEEVADRFPEFKVIVEEEVE